MAKLYKVEMYITDLDEHYGSLEDTIVHINDRLENVELVPFFTESVEFEYGDDHELNTTVKDIGMYRKYFYKELKE